MSDDSGVLVFQVQGYRGPMTLAFKPLGKHPYAPADVTDEAARQLSLEEVQEWYTEHGWPSRGQLRTATKRGLYKGLFEMVS